VSPQSTIDIDSPSLKKEWWDFLFRITTWSWVETVLYMSYVKNKDRNDKAWVKFTRNAIPQSWNDWHANSWIYFISVKAVWLYEFI
jgi:hypothetical protein